MSGWSGGGGQRWTSVGWVSRSDVVACSFIAEGNEEDRTVRGRLGWRCPGIKDKGTYFQIIFFLFGLFEGLCLFLAEGPLLFDQAAIEMFARVE